MNLSLVLLLASLAVAGGPEQPNQPVPLATAAEPASSPYVEISDLPPVPAKRIIRAQPRAVSAPQVAARHYDIAPIGAVPPPASTIVPAGANTVLQPVEPAATRPYIAPAVQPTIAPCPSPAAAARVVYPSYPAVATPAQVTYSVQPQIAYMPIVQETGVKVGRGIIGQPKLYVDGQPIRNALRWLTP